MFRHHPWPRQVAGNRGGRFERRRGTWLKIELGLPGLGNHDAGDGLPNAWSSSTLTVCNRTRACGPHFHLLPPNMVIVHWASIGVN